MNNARSDESNRFSTVRTFFFRSILKYSIRIFLVDEISLPSSKLYYRIFFFLPIMYAYIYIYIFLYNGFPFSSVHKVMIFIFNAQYRRYIQ